MTPADLLKAMFGAAVEAALPDICVPPYLPARPKGRTIVIGAGKASGAMAKAVEDHWQGPLEGLVVTRYGHRLPTTRIEVVEAAHPVPDAAGREAADAHPQAGAGLERRRPRALPHLGRRLGPARRARRGREPRGQAGGEQGAAQIGRHHRRDERGAEAPLGHQGRPARARRRARQCGGAHDLRRAGRRSFRDRLRPHRRRSFDLCRRARHPGEIQHRRAAGGDGAAQKRRRGDAEAGRPAAGPRREHHDRHPASLARSGRRARAQRGRHARSSSAMPSRASRATWRWSMPAWPSNAPTMASPRSPLAC